MCDKAKREKEFKMREILELAKLKGTTLIHAATPPIDIEDYTTMIMLGMDIIEAYGVPEVEDGLSPEEQYQTVYGYYITSLIKDDIEFVKDSAIDAVVHVLAHDLVYIEVETTDEIVEHGALAMKLGMAAAKNAVIGIGAGVRVAAASASANGLGTRQDRLRRAGGAALTGAIVSASKSVSLFQGVSDAVRNTSRSLQDSFTAGGPNRDARRQEQDRNRSNLRQNIASAKAAGMQVSGELAGLSSSAVRDIAKSSDPASMARGLLANMAAKQLEKSLAVDGRYRFQGEQPRVEGETREQRDARVAANRALRAEIQRQQGST
jgi:hypothetical protein